jgi:hypothetical protein
MGIDHFLPETDIQDSKHARRRNHPAAYTRFFANAHGFEACAGRILLAGVALGKSWQLAKIVYNGVAS